MPTRIGAAFSNRFDESQRVLDRLVLQRSAPNDEAEANIRWGEASDFDLVGGSGSNVSQPTINIIWPPDPECEFDILRNSFFLGQGEDGCDPPVEVLQYNEIDRETENVRVENPNDSSQYVIVQRILKILFQGPDGRYYLYILNPPSSA